MKIDNQFSVNVPIDEAWNALTDLERIAPCMPGAQLTGRDGDAYLGTVKVKVGPVISEFAGTASFIEKDDANYHAIIDAKGRDSRGSGNASATITAQLRSDSPTRTTVVVETDMKISGKLAQFGSGMIAEVSSKLLGQFADSLEQLLTEAPETASETSSVVKETDDGATGGAAPAAFRPSAAPQPVDLTQLAGGAVAKRLLPVLAGVVVIGVIIYVIVR
ncbi:MAG TPA: SRPBCC family protein [Acidothermaceae bacterium]|jgi:carbon monoxide dehydrogenase subunit G|nr:SRPBCC family protein [Acidothermaceae bacterium]